MASQPEVNSPYANVDLDFGKVPDSPDKAGAEEVKQQDQPSYDALGDLGVPNRSPGL